MKTLPVILIILSLFAGCRKTSLIPEITPNLASKPMYTLKGKRPISQLGKSGSGLIFITPKNEIKQFDPVTRKLDTLLQLKQPVATRFFSDGTRLIIKSKTGSDWSVIDLKNQSVLKTVRNLPADKIIGHKDSLICFQKGPSLGLYDYQSPRLLQEIHLDAEHVFNCEFKGLEILILTSKKLHVYNLKTSRLNSYNLSDQSVSGFLLLDGFIYYGSTGRELIKLSLKTRKIKWKIKLAMPLKNRPQKIGKLIVFSPEDNNIYFFNRNGTLRWWEKLEATRMRPPIIMKENVAVLLLNKQIKFFNPKTKKVKEFSFKSSLDSNPVHLDSYLYFLAHKKNKKIQRITRLGNLYQVNIKADPEHIKPLGQSIQFNLKPVNLIKPVLEINIIDQKEQPVFTKTLKYTDIMSFVWIPKKAGKYELKLNVVAKNRERMTIKKSITITDIEKIIQSVQQKIIRNCPADLFEPPSAPR
jgi:hypothetical protein